MGFCSNCGEELPEDAYFCPKCGARTIKGAEAGVSSPMDDLRDAFNKMNQEIEKAFSIASREIQKAFKTARENVKQSIYREPISCPQCGEKSPSDSNFCYKCGKKLAN
jgi:uncharacterized membrane protein YvbJ